MHIILKLAAGYVTGLSLIVVAGFICYYLINRYLFQRLFPVSKTKNLTDFCSGTNINIPHNELLPALTQSFHEFRPIMYANVMGLPGAFITNLEELASVFRFEAEMSSNHEVLVPWLGQGILTDGCTNYSEGPDEGYGMLSGYLDIANRNAIILVQQIQNEANHDEVYINNKIYLCLLDIMCESGLGVQINAQLGEEQEYVSTVLALCRLIHKRQILSWLLRPCVFNLTPTGREQNKLRKRVMDFSKEVILHRIQVLEAKECEIFDSSEENYKKNDQGVCSYLDLLLKGEEKLTLDELQEEVNNFMFSSHDKTSAAVIWTLFEMGHSQDAQEIAYLEQRDIFGESNREVEAEDLEQMTYLDRVIKEIFRLYPSTPIISRRLKKDVKIQGYDVPAGTDIPIFVYYINRNPELYPDPGRFNPDRFLPNRKLNLRSESFTPLIFGPRYSFVEEFAITKHKIILSHLLRNFKFKSMDKRDDLKLMGEFILRPENNLRISFTQRLKRNP